MMPSNGQIPGYGNAAKDEAIEVWGRAWGGVAPYSVTLDYGDGSAPATWSGVSESQAAYYLGAAHTYTAGGRKTVAITVVDSQGETKTRQSVINVHATTTQEDRVNIALEKSLLFLYKNKQEVAASTPGRVFWYGNNTSYYAQGSTAFAVLAFEENGHLPGNDYESDIYAETVQKGLNQLFANSNIRDISILAHSDGVSNRDPDIFLVNGKGVALTSDDHGVYQSSVTALAIIMSQPSAAAARSKLVENGTLTGRSYYNVIADALDQYAFCMGDGSQRGGYGYAISSQNAGGRYDGSSQQWPALAFLAAKERWGVEMPQWLVDNVVYGFEQTQILNDNYGAQWNGAVNYYDTASSGKYWPTSGKTGGALVAYALKGVQNATVAGTPEQKGYAFIGRQWGNLNNSQSTSNGEFWGSSAYNAYGIKKGLQLQGVNTVDAGAMGVRNWYSDMASWFLGEAATLDPSIGSNQRNVNYGFGQNTDGSWTTTAWPFNSTSYKAITTAKVNLVLTKSVTRAVPVALINSISDISCLRSSSFQLNASRTYHSDPALSVVEYLWDLDDRDGVDWNNPDAVGAVVNTNTPSADWRGNGSPATRTITLRVKDNANPENIVTATVVVNLVNTDLPPVAVAIPAGVQPPVYTSRVGDTISLDGSGSYEPDADLGQTIVGYAWDLDGNGTYGDAADAALDQSGGGANAVTAQLIYNNAYSGQVSLKVTSSSGGLTGVSATPINIYVAPSDLSVASLTASNVIPGTSVDVSAVLASDAASGSAANNVRVRFYGGNPLQNGTPLATIPAGQDFIVTIPAAGSVTVNATLALPVGVEEVFVYVDSSDVFPEFDESNNILGKNVAMTVVNEGLSVLPASFKVIDNAALSTDDGGRSTAVGTVYTVEALPTGGVLNLDGVAVTVGSTFTQADIDAGKLTYEQTEPGITSDLFEYSVALTSGESVPTTEFLITVSKVEAIGGLDGVPGNGDAIMVSISKNGRYVAFQSKSSNLVAGDANGVDDVFLHDRATGVTTLVSQSTAGVQGNAASVSPRISADGRWIVFHSAANNLVAGDTNQKNDVFVHDRISGTTERVSLPDSSQVASQGNGDSWYASISGDGNLVAFHSYANNLVAGDSMAQTDVFLHDRSANTTIRLSVVGGTEGNNASTYPVVSEDGSVVVFQSLATNLVPGDTNGRADVYLYDVGTHALSLISRAQDGVTLGNLTSVQPTVSANGRYVAYQSSASNLVPGDSNNVTDIFVYDRSTGTLTLASVNDAGMIGNSASSDARISDDGRYVTFHSNARNLSTVADNNVTTDIFVRDLRDQKTYRVNLAPDLSEASGGASTRPDISGSGRYVAYISKATNLRTAANGVDQVYVTGFNSRPSITGIPDQTLPEDTATDALPFVIGDDMTAGPFLDVTVTSADPTLVDVDNGGAVLAGDGTNMSVVVTPVANAYGTTTITITVSDGSLSAQTSFQVTFTPVDDVPSLDGKSYTVAEEFPLDVNAAEGVLDGATTDVDGEAISVALLDGPSHGTLTLNPDGSFLYLPEPNYYGPDSFRFTATAGAGTSEPVTVNITVTDEPDAPIAYHDLYAMNRDGVLSVPSRFGVLANDYDADGDQLVAFLVVSPSYGSLVLNEDGGFTYEPNAMFTGYDYFVYTANDGFADSEFGLVEINVHAPSNRPLGMPDSFTMSQGGTLTLPAPGVLANDTNPLGGSFQAIQLTFPENGVATLNPDGSLTYTPDANFVGVDQFTYEGSNADGRGSTNQISIVVQKAGMAPELVAPLTPQIAVYQNAFSWEIPVEAFTSPKGTPLIDNVTGLPPGMTFDPQTRTVSGSPEDTGVYFVTVEVFDSVSPNFRANSFFTLTVNPAPLTVTANDAERFYGAPNPALSVRYSGFLNGEDASVLDVVPTASTAANALSNAGLYPIIAAGGVDNHYAITHVAGVLTVAKAPLAANGPDVSRLYGAANPALPVSYSGFVNGDDADDLDVAPVASTAVVAITPVGTYEVSLSAGSDNNYVIGNTSGTIEVGKAPLTVTADDQIRPFGSVNPPLTATYSGFVNGEDASVIDHLATVATTAMVNSLVGAYPITVSGATDGNYDITHVAGTLTVIKADTQLSIVPPALQPVFGRPAVITGAILPRGASGQVQLLEGGTVIATGEIVRGRVTWTVSGLLGGTRSLVARYLGDGSYNVVDSPVTAVTVAKTVSAVSLRSTVNPAYHSYAVGLIATVTAPEVQTPGSPVQTGTVSFFEGGTLLGVAPVVNGVARFNANSMGIGEHTVTALYIGDANHLVATSAPIVQRVQKITPSVLIGASASAVNFRDPVTFTVMIFPASVTGNVTFLDGENVLGVVPVSANFVYGEAVLTTTGLGTGVRNVTARYNGDGVNSANTSMILPVTVRGAGRAPVAAEDFFNVYRNKSVVIPVQSLLVNDTDPDGDTVRFISVGSSTAAGAQVVAANGFINYTAPLNYVGVDTFTYVIEDGNGNQAVGTAQISVTDSETISLVSIRDEGGVVTVRFLGSPGRVYTVEHQGFVGGDWTKRANLTAPRRSVNGLPLGVFEYSEPSGQSGFFRAVSPAY